MGNPYWIDSPSTSLINKLSKSDSVKYYNPEDIIFYQGEVTDYIYYLCEGQVKIVLYWEDGSMKTVGMHESGSFIGEISSINKQPQFTTAISTKKSVIKKVKANVFVDHCCENKDLLVDLLQHLGRKVHRLTMQIGSMSFLNVEKRVCYALLKLSQDKGVNTSQGLKISSRLTDESLANLVGTTRVSVSRVLNSLVKIGYIRKIKNYIYITDSNKLKIFTFSRKSLTWKGSQ